VGVRVKAAWWEWYLVVALLVLSFLIALLDASHTPA
jgi:hypothetical protein